VEEGGGSGRGGRGGLAAAVRLEESGRRKRWGWEPVEVRVRISSGEFGLPVLG